MNSTMSIPTGTALLDQVRSEFLDGDPIVALDHLFAGLNRVRARLAPSEWRVFAKQTAIEHPVRDLIHEDPMMRRAFEKPRGYAGDAVLIDYIYRLRRAEGVGHLGEAIYDYATSARPAALGVQTRRRIVARAIDRLRERPVGNRRVLSVACGHFREGHLSRAFQAGEIDEVIGLDSDADSLGVVDENFATRNVATVHASVTKLLKRDYLGEFDLVYSSGLYDYLDDRFAKRLTEALFARLRPGGTLLLCNFVPQIFDAGLMETYMGWDLIYRAPDQLRAVASDVPTDDIRDSRTWTDSHDAVVYLELTRR